MLSTEKHRLELRGNCSVYAREGVSHLWVVDVRDRTLEAFELRGGEWTRVVRRKDEDTASTAPFDSGMFSLADLGS